MSRQVRVINTARCLNANEATYVIAHLKTRARACDRVWAHTHAGAIEVRAFKEPIRSLRATGLFWRYEFTLAGEPTLQVDLWRRLVGLAP